ncbi:hypothetical protein [Saccharopolyspora taberi]|uniref:DUF4760 domain-containing protein n=1 Tax=Saccharopolyspora taberi TaxID=60895 RepID=A0ABN3VNS0_9PSEU
MAQWLSSIVAMVACAISLGALFVSRRQAGVAAEQLAVATRQAETAKQAYHHARQISHSQATVNFVERFLGLIRGGKKFDDPEWSFEFWSLYTIEFYFFHNDMIPDFMYRLWMKDLAFIYLESEDAWESHERYLKDFQMSYDEMHEFFDSIKGIAMSHRADQASRARAVERFVGDWKGKFADDPAKR